MSIFFTIHFISLASLVRPTISLPISNYTFYTGVSIPNIPVFIDQPHYPITISPSLPSTVSLLPRVNGISGYILTGFFGNENVYDFLITARNNRGSDSVHLKIEVSGKASIFPFINSNVD